MSVSDGEKVNAAITNAAFLSRKTDSDTVAVIGLKNPGSGADVNNAQQAINDNIGNISTNTSNIATNTSNIATNASDISTNAGNIATNAANIATNTGDISANTSDIADIRTTTGTSDGDTNMGAYASATITDGQSTKQNIIDVVTQTDQNTSDIATLQSNPVFNLKGTWNASTNTPTLADGVGTTGDAYKVTVAGTQDLGSGNISFIVGDLIYYDGAVWFKDAEPVFSVNGLQGTVVLDADDISDAATTNKFAIQAQLDKVDNITVTQPVDLDTLESDVSANNAKVSNATHTGEVTGDTTLTVDPTAISNKTSETPVSGDFFLFSDTSDGGALKKANFDALGGAGGSGDWTYTGQSANYTASVNDFVGMDATGGARTVTLPTSSGNAGKRIAVKKLDSSSNAVTVDGDSAETIDGAATFDLRQQYDTLVVVSDGTNWVIQGYYFLEADQEATSAGEVTYSITVNQWGDLTSLALPPGKYSIDIVTTTRNTADGNAGAFNVGCSTNSGNNGAGLVRGDNLIEGFSGNLADGSGGGTGDSRLALTLAEYVVEHSTTTTYYAKALKTGGTLNMVVAYRMTATRLN